MSKKGAPQHVLALEVEGAASQRRGVFAWVLNAHKQRFAIRCLGDTRDLASFADQP